jgi:hypothetical protein
MTIASENRTAGPFAGNGTTVAFPFTFTQYDPSHVRVALRGTDGVYTDLTYGVDYTVVLNGDQDNVPGGVATLGTAPAVGEAVAFFSAAPFLQLTDLQNQGGFFPSTLEQALDNIVIQTQQLRQEIKRSVRAAPGRPDMAPFTPTAGAYLAFDGDLNPVPASGTGADAGLREDLAEPSGSSLVGHTNSHTGEFAQSVQARLTHHVNVMDFIDRDAWTGLEAGTNTDNQSAAFAAAIATGKRVNVPAATFYANIEIDRNNVELIGEAYRNTILRPFTTGAPLILLDGDEFGAILQGTAIQNMAMVGAAKTAPAIKIASTADARGADHCRFADLFAFGFTTMLDVQGRAVWNHMSRLHSYENLDGFRIETDQACNAWRWESCVAERNDRHGLYVHKTDISVGGFLSWTFDNLDCEFNGRDTAQAVCYGVYLSGVEGFGFRELYLENNGTDLVSEDSYGFLLTGDLGRAVVLSGVTVANSKRLIWVDGEKKSGSIKDVRAFLLPGETDAVTIASTYANAEPKMLVDEASVFNGAVVYTADVNENHGARAVDYIGTPGTSLDFTYRDNLTVSTAGGAVSINTLTGLQPSRRIIIAAAGANAVTIAAGLMADGNAKVIASNTAVSFMVGGHPVSGKLWSL